MYHADLVGSPQRSCCLCRNTNCARDPEWPLDLQNLADVLALHQFHDNEGAAIFGVIEVVDSDGIRMPELSSNNRFCLKALQESFIAGNDIIDDFDGAHLVEGEVSAAIYNPHSANAYAVQKLVLIANDHSGLEFVSVLQSGLIRWAHVVVDRIRLMTCRAVFHGQRGAHTPAAR